ncbi:SNF2 family N-terminal domain-containing protein [Ochromonadaceae sp. CCMP2298]|nr:SNF2 family N-terminal domain-containing protein [Ochromonadaceae sp. CCMP2298]
MRDYQLQGANWLKRSYEEGINVILADEMGLGKTIQTIAYIGSVKFEMKKPGAFLVVVPLSVLSNWMNEFKRFLPAARVLKLHSGDKAERERLKKVVLPSLSDLYDVVVTTYEMAKNPNMQHALVSSIVWRGIVLDEGHVVRNEATCIASTMRRMHYQHAVLLTGTPLQNNLHELWSLLNLLQPEIFRSSAQFDACFDISSSKHIVDQQMLLKVHSLLQPFMLRRIKADVETTVPPKVEKKILCPLSDVQTHWYKRLLLKDSSLLAALDADEGAKGGDVTAQAESAELKGQANKFKRLQALFAQLRKVCNHPFLFEDADPHPTWTDETVVQASGKMQILDRLLSKLMAGGHRVVLFSQFTQVLDILGDYLNLRDIPHCRLDGSTNRVERQVLINTFNAPNSPYFLFLMSTRAGGLGVNLQTADTVILYDSDWNPMVDLQVML